MPDLRPARRDDAARGSTRNRGLGRAGLHLILAVAALAMLVPFGWMVLSSFKDHADIAHFPPRLLPEHWRFGNYPEMLRYAPFGTYARNSLIIAVAHTAINLVVASMAGYVLARVPFPGRPAVFAGVLTTLMIPTYAKVVPQYLLAKSVPYFGGNDWLGRGGTGWLDSWWALIVPGAVTPFAIFLFRQFYLSLPSELEDAARLDGLNEFGIYLRIMTPLVKPAIATVGLLTFQESWNNFLWPLLVTTSDRLRVIQVGLSVMHQPDRGGTEWAYLLAGSTLATLPMVVLFLACQRYFVQGFARAGLK